tara:strand:- start:1409 stop:1735 length:327 start_codon:yes stop_codon:yes gene_type:complete
MADVASITSELSKGLSGKEFDLDGSIVTLDFEEGIVCLDGSLENGPTNITVSNEVKTSDATVKMSCDLWEQLKQGTTTSSSAFLNGDIKIEGDLAAVRKLQAIFDSVK